MSRGHSNSDGSFRTIRDYGATSSTAVVPDVDFAGFSPTEFMSLSETIAQNIGSVKSSWQTLEKSIKIIGTSRDNHGTREKVHQIQSMTNTKIQMTSKDLQRLTVVVRRGDKQQKLQVEKLTSEFKFVVEKYSTSQQIIANKMKAILLTNASQNDDIIQDAKEMGSGDVDDNNDNNEMLRQQQKMLKQNLEFKKGILLEREQRVRQIEADVLDVNEIMRDLSTLINQQSENINTIESSIDHASSNIETGTSELIKAAQSQAKYRRKVLILLAIAVIIGLIVTGIIVSQLKS